MTHISKHPGPDEVVDQPQDPAVKGRLGRLPVRIRRRRQPPTGVKAPTAAKAPTGVKAPTAAKAPTMAKETPSFDPIQEAHEAFVRICELLNPSQELPQLKSEETRVVVKTLIDNLESKIDALIEQGANAATNQVLVVVLVWSGSEDELASQAESSEADKEILRVIQDKFIKARVPFWTALASLGKVKEWSASLEVSANLLAIKGTGGISVTFGR